MNDHPLNHGAISPEEQMGNVCDSLADDVFNGAIEIDRETTERASRLARAAIKDALGSPPASLD
jgi:hypothetical protein